MSPAEETPEIKTLFAQRFRGFLPVIVDVETGGFNAETDALLEVAAVTLAWTKMAFCIATKHLTAT